MARFLRRGVSKIMFAPTISNIDTVSRSEITSATDLTDEIAEVTGFMVESTQIPTPDLGSRFESNIVGPDSAGDSALTLYEDDLTDVLELLLAKDTEGFILIFRKGDKPASKSLDVFPTRIGSKSADISVGNDPARFKVSCSITSPPALDTLIPTAP